ncbi:MAG TPA: argininosuccinate synthase [Cytophagales bacterium]|nr:argininosuccinate synthase [Cytophagales bacterium]
MKKKVVLAYSGGLDTSFCVKYLIEDLGFEVHSVLVDTGGFTKEELASVEKRAYELGVKKHTTIDALSDFYEECIKYLIFGNVLRNNTYPLSVSAERIFQAKAIANHAKSIHADAVAHGSTGAGNDQVRFDMIFNILIPKVEIITPIRDMKLSREAEIEYLKEKGVSMDWSKAQYSINQGIWGTSVGGKETLSSDQYLPEEAFPSQLKKSEPEEVKLIFEKGELVQVNSQKFNHPVEAIQKLQAIAGPYAIGRDIHVGDTIIGIKGRVGFEAAAPLIIIKAHHLLEKHTLTKWQQYWKEMLSNWYGMAVHEGQLLEPVMRDIERFLTHSQIYVSGEVTVKLLPYRFVVQGVQSDNDLMSAKFGAYGEMNEGWTGEDVKGFSKIFSNQISMFHQIHSKHEN